MAVKDDHVSVLRAFLAADFDEYDRLSERLDQAVGWEGYEVLLQAAFFEAVDRKFGEHHTVPEIIQYVADARSRYERSGQAVNPSVAERLMLISLGHDESVDDADGRAIGAAQLFITTAVITEENLDAAGLDEFMNEVRKTAGEWPSS
jgi:hypothetical protein